MMEDMLRHVIVRGRVQGVGFRAFVETEAERHPIRGWVRNRRDGSVEAVFSGPPASVEALTDACRRGPPSARIDDFEMREADASELALTPRGIQFAALATI